MDPCDCSKSELLPMLPIWLHQVRLWLRVQGEDMRHQLLRQGQTLHREVEFDG
ncbi:Hypothetical protein SMAX5B_017851 [Scophthalmus maximus]|uniref:Uncharacterized protein n=1 Tax=Scophthalmus maximus TaxID=52904 RepID=A0A2U9BYB4_SCOMX|nr:Hypothetical protein SMAX5B_017851 [Scophthalmus maximus]